MTENVNNVEEYRFLKSAPVKCLFQLSGSYFYMQMLNSLVSLILCHTQNIGVERQNRPICTFPCDRTTYSMVPGKFSVPTMSNSSSSYHKNKCYIILLWESTVREVHALRGMSVCHWMSTIF